MLHLAPSPSCRRRATPGRCPCKEPGRRNSPLPNDVLPKIVSPPQRDEHVASDERLYRGPSIGERLRPTTPRCTCPLRGGSRPPAGRALQARAGPPPARSRIAGRYRKAVAFCGHAEWARTAGGEAGGVLARTLCHLAGQGDDAASMWAQYRLFSGSVPAASRISLLGRQPRSRHVPACSTEPTTSAASQRELRPRPMELFTLWRRPLHRARRPDAAPALSGRTAARQGQRSIRRRTMRIRVGFWATRCRAWRTLLALCVANRSVRAGVAPAPPLLRAGSRARDDAVERYARRGITAMVRIMPVLAAAFRGRRFAATAAMKRRSVPGRVPGGRAARKTRASFRTGPPWRYSGWDRRCLRRRR